MNNKKKYRRRQYYLPGTSQLRLLFSTQILLTALAMVIAVVFYSISNRDLTESYWSAHVAIDNTLEILLPTLVVVNLVGLVASLVFFIFFTHRIVGPVYRIRMILREVAKGDLRSRVNFRKHDYLKELAVDANLALDSLREELGVMKQLSADLTRLWEQRYETSDVPAEEQDDVAATIQELSQRLDKFKLQ